jgi:hypothetical protein
LRKRLAKRTPQKNTAKKRKRIEAMREGQELPLVLRCELVSAGLSRLITAFFVLRCFQRLFHASL